jgi:hypothetical protein
MISPALPLDSQATIPNLEPQRKPYVCPECWKEAILSEEKRLPDEGAVLMKAVHTDKSVPDHTWKDYDFDASSITIPSRPPSTATATATQTILPIHRGPGRPKKTKTREKSQRYECTVCHKPAVRYVDKKDQHITFEHRDEPALREDRYYGKLYKRYRRCNGGTNVVSKAESDPVQGTKTITITITEYNELLKIKAEIDEIRTKQKRIAAREKRIRTEQKALEADKKDLQRLLEADK